MTPSFLLTFDVETYSFGTNQYEDSVAAEVFHVGLPRLVDLLDKYSIKATFFFTGQIAALEPGCVRLVKAAGHEVGCHGYWHEVDRAFDTLSYEEQIKDLFLAKAAIETVAGKVISFRAPAARINENTVLALEKTGFQIDSSIASQRFDGPLTFGARKKLAWLTAPRGPYYLSYESINRRGQSPILELPISAALLPYIGTTMRISPLTTKILQSLLFLESRKTGRPIVFLFHPNECLDAPTSITTTRRARSTIKYYLADRLRHQLKQRNLGLPSLMLLDGVIKDALRYGFSFLTMSEYAELTKRKCEGV